MHRIKLFLRILLVPATLVPVLVFAEPSPEPANHPQVSSRTDPQHTPSQSPGSQLCTRFTQDTGGLSGDLSSRFGQLQNNFGQRPTAVNLQFQNVSSKLQSDRTLNSTKLSSDFARLSALATTPAERTAVQTFEAEVLAAIKTRNAAVDLADSTFHTGIQSAVSSHQSSEMTAAEAYRTAVTAALATAKAGCTAGTDPATVAATLHSSLQQALTALQAQRQSADRTDPNIQTLEAARHTAVSAAVAAFQAQVKLALANLQTVLPKPSPSASPAATPKTD